MSTFEKLLELINYKREATNAGSKAAVEKQHGDGKLTARERVLLLFDEGTFVEIGALVAKESSVEGVITGYGTIDGRLVYAYAQDVTIDGGAVSDRHAEKIVKILDYAKKNGAPVISLMDSNGARIGDGLDTLAAMGKILNTSALLSGVVPQISIILGNCAGAAVFTPATADFTIMVNQKSSAFLAGPAVVYGVSGEEVTSESLGGATAHAENSGLADLVAASDSEAIAMARQLIAFLPSNNLENALPEVPTDEINRLSENMVSLLEGEYDVTAVIGQLADSADIFETMHSYSKGIFTGFIRLNGYPTGVIANQPSEGGRTLTVKSLKKASKFLAVCDSFHIPVLSLIDVEGFEISKESEYNGISLYAAKLLASYAEAVVPKVTVVLGKAYGSAYLAMGGFQADFTLASPAAEICVLSPDSAANILYHDEIAAAEDPVFLRQAKTTEYQTSEATPYAAAAKGYLDDVVEPDSLRPRVISAFDMLYTKRELRIPKKHHNFSV